MDLELFANAGHGHPQKWCSTILLVTFPAFLSYHLAEIEYFTDLKLYPTVAYTIECPTATFSSPQGPRVH